MNPNKLFILKYDRISEIVTRRQEGELIELAGILRLMLLDAQNLVDVVNNERRIKLYYPVGKCLKREHEEQQAKFPEEWSPPMISWTSIVPKEGRVNVGKKQFLSHAIMYFTPNNHTEGFYYTVKDCIKICANRLGGVHFSSPESDKENEAVMRAFNDHVFMYDVPISFSTLAEIGLSFLDGAQVLYKELLSEQA